MSQAPDPPFAARVDALQSDLDGETLVAYSGPNTNYLAGFFGEPLDRHLLVLVGPTGNPRVVAPEKCRHVVADSWLDGPAAVPDNDPGAVARAAADLVETETVLVDDRAPFGVTGPLDAATEASVEPAGALLATHRLRKDDSEVARLRESATVADAVSRDVRALGAGAVGRTEADLAAEVRSRLHAAGGTRLSFDVVVASGPHAAEPYRRSSDRRIRAGEPVILDFGAFVGGYASDQTRTVVFEGEPPEGFEEAHEAVVAAVEAGVEAVEPGVSAGAVDRATEAVVRERGYGDGLVHATGHGVGLDAHEAPTIADGNERELEPGMVFSIEPGVYVEGEFGVRIEDLVVVTDEGCERLNDSPKTWQPLEE
ncbi:MAG: Xaa-Pro peptidase family protein [Haloarculaceae archaeon]